MEWGGQQGKTGSILYVVWAGLIEQVLGKSGETYMAEEKDLFSVKSDYAKETTVPVGPIGIIPMKGTENMAKVIDSFLVGWRKERQKDENNRLIFSGYNKDSFILDCELSRFGSGEGKGLVTSTVRGHDLYFLVDVTNHSVCYSMGGLNNHYSPDDHYQDLKRMISAASGQAKRMTVIMPFLYEGRMHNRDARESLDCAQMLKELAAMGVDNIVTFDANDPRVVNAIPLNSFDTISPSYQYIKTLCNKYDDIIIDSEHLATISPDESGMGRAVYLANVLGVDMGMFYERKDYSRQEGDDYPVVAHEYLGAPLEGKDVIIVDDMISSGAKILNVASRLKSRKAKRVFCCVTYGLFTNGLSRFDEAYDKGIIDRVFTTNLIYQPPELLSRKWYSNVNMGKYVALIIDYLNHDDSISPLLTPVDRINKFLSKYKERQRRKGIIA